MGMVVLIGYYTFFLRDFLMTKKIINIISLIFIIVCLHFSVASFFFPEFNFFRGGLSIILLLMMVYSAYLLADLICCADPLVLRSTLKKVMIVFILSFIGSFFPVIQNFNNVKPILPYNEPSHYTLFFVPVYFYFAFVVTPKYKIFYILFGLAIALILKNLTLLVGVVILIFILYKFKSVMLIPICLVFLITYIDLAYFIDRVDFNSKTTNLSTLVFLQGWQLSWESIKNTFGWGIGFQQLGFVKIETEAGNSIIKLMGRNVNETDAGLTFGKVVAEFGVLGFIAVLTYLRYFVKYFRKVNYSNIVKTKPSIVFAYAVFLSFFLEIFIRGIGYFNPPFLLFVCSIFILIKERRSHINENNL